MLESDVIEVDGVFVGAAILQPNHNDVTFFAAHERVRALHGQILPDLATVREQAARYFRRGAFQTAPQQAQAN